MTPPPMARLDHYCVAHYGEARCRQWAQDQQAPPTFFDEADLAVGGGATQTPLVYSVWRIANEMNLVACSEWLERPRR